MTSTAKPKRARRFARTPKGETAVGENSQASAKNDAAPSAPKGESGSKGESKIGSVIALLQRAEGATLDEMLAATGWQPHTTRAALTGLRKKGHTITRGKRDDLTCYRTTEPA